MLTRLIGGNRVDHFGYCHRVGFPHNTKLGMGLLIGVVLILAMLLIMWMTKEKEEIMKKFAKVYLTIAFLCALFTHFLSHFLCLYAGGDMNGFTGFTLEHFSSCLVTADSC